MRGQSRAPPEAVPAPEAVPIAVHDHPTAIPDAVPVATCGSAAARFVVHVEGPDVSPSKDQVDQLHAFFAPAITLR